LDARKWKRADDYNNTNNNNRMNTNNNNEENITINLDGAKCSGCDEYLGEDEVGERCEECEKDLDEEDEGYCWKHEETILPCKGCVNGVMCEDWEEDEEDGFEDCEDCGYTHHYEDKCPIGEQCEKYEKWREEDE
jgi:hypothetical protein